MIHKTEIRPDRKYYVSIVDGVRQFHLKDKTRQQVCNNAIKTGLKNWIIESFWASEYE